jgi:rhodanese-related sulfurtransferase
VDFLLNNWVLVLAALTSGILLLWPTITGGAGAAVSPTQAVQLINREKAVVIDVCESAEFAAGHVTGARNVPLSTLSGESKQLPSNKALPVLVLCQSGMRATRAAGMLRKLGYEKALPVSGGLKAWREAGLPVDKGA